MEQAFNLTYDDVTCMWHHMPYAGINMIGTVENILHSAAAVGGTPFGVAARTQGQYHQNQVCVCEACVFDSRASAAAAAATVSSSATFAKSHLLKTIPTPSSSSAATIATLTNASLGGGGGIGDFKTFFKQGWLDAMLHNNSSINIHIYFSFIFFLLINSA